LAQDEMEFVGSAMMSQFKTTNILCTVTLRSEQDVFVNK